MLASPKALRRPAVAGYYYPQDPEALATELMRVTGVGTRGAVAPRAQAFGVIVPHGSFQRCGAVAGQTLARVAVPRRCVILGPSHTGMTSSWSLLTESVYTTPLGEVALDEPLAEALLAIRPDLDTDQTAHVGEHAIEVVLPFLQWLGPADLSIVPLLIAGEQREAWQLVSQALAAVIQALGEPVLVVASSDFTHYEPEAEVRRRDRRLLESLAGLEAEQLLRTVQDLRVMMCGCAAVACALDAAKRLGASRAEVVAYDTSVQAGGDPNSAIGYAGVHLLQQEAAHE